MEDAGRQHGIGAPQGDAIDQMLQVAHAAGCDDGNGHRIADGTGQLQIEADAGAVPVHAGQQDLARPQVGHAARPFQGIQPGVVATAVGIDMPAAFGLALGVDGHHQTLRAVVAGGIGHQLRIVDGGRVDRHLVGADVQQSADVIHAADAAAHRQRNEDLLRHRLDDVQDGVALVGRSGDVEKGQLVGPLGVIATRHLHRVACVAQVHEVDTLHHPAVGHVQAGNDASGQLAAVFSCHWPVPGPHRSPACPRRWSGPG